MYYQAHNYQAEDSVGFLLHQAMSALRRRLDRELAALDLTSNQWLLLMKVGRRQLKTAAEVAQALNHGAAAVTRMVDRLEAKGLLTRERSQIDRRVVELTLTPAGTELLPALTAVAVAVLNQALADFERDEFEQMKHLLRRFAAALTDDNA